MRAKYWWAVALPILLVALLASVAGADPSLYVDPALTEVWTGDDFWVEISVNEELLGLTGYDLTIDFDESVLEVLQVLEGPLPQSSGSSFFYWTTGPAPENAIVINGAILGAAVDGPGVLALVHFSALTPGISPVEFVEFELRDLENAPIAVTAIDGEVHVTDYPLIYLTPETTMVPEGTEFTIDIAINESVRALTGYSLKITLDSSVVRYAAPPDTVAPAVEGPLPPSGGDPTHFDWILEDNDTIIIQGAVLGGWVDGPGVLATLNLVALYQGATEVVFELVDLRDIDNNPIFAYQDNAVVIVTPGGSPVEETSWSALKSLYR
jgi:hypothetical protein